MLSQPGYQSPRTLCSSGGGSWLVGAQLWAALHARVRSFRAAFAGRSRGRAAGRHHRRLHRLPGDFRTTRGGVSRDAVPVVLNCYRARSRQWSHAVLAVDYAASPRRLLTVDPNDGLQRWLNWLRPTTGWICTATFIVPLPPRWERLGEGTPGAAEASVTW